MQILKKLFAPNIVDSVLFLSSLVCVLAWALWAILTYFMDYPDEWVWGPLSAIAIVMIALASCVAWGRAAVKRTIFLFCICLLGLFLPTIIAFWLGIGSTIENEWSSRWWYMEERSSDAPKLWNALQIATIPLGVSLLAWIGVLVFRFLPVWVLKTIRFFGGQFTSEMKIEITRPKMLIGIAACLFVVAIANNILRASGWSAVSEESLGLGMLIEIFISSFICLLLFGFLVVWPSTTAQSWCLRF